MTSTKTLLIKAVLFFASIVGIIWILIELIINKGYNSIYYALIFFIILAVILGVTGGITYTKTRSVRTVRTRTTSS